MYHEDVLGSLSSGEGLKNSTVNIPGVKFLKPTDLLPMIWPRRPGNKFEKFLIGGFSRSRRVAYGEPVIGGRIKVKKCLRNLINDDN